MNFSKPFPIELQMDSMDCGPACLKMVCKYYGKYYSLQFLRDKCGITKEGVSLLDIGHAAENIGLRTLSMRCNLDELIHKVPLPAILHWDNSHFVVVYKIRTTAAFFGFERGSKFFVADPAKGLIEYNDTEFTAKWVSKVEEQKGVVMVLEPQNDFYQKSVAEKSEQMKTLRDFLGYFRRYTRSFGTLFLVMLLITTLQALLPFMSKAVIDVGIRAHDMQFINMLLVGNIFLYVSILLGNMARDWIFMHISARVNIALISDYLIKLMRLPITFFETKMTGDILQRAQDLDRIRSFVMNNSVNMIFSSLTFFVFAIILFIYNTFIFTIFLVGSAVYLAWVFAFLGLRKKFDWQYFELVSKNQSFWVETLASIQDIKINNYEKPKRWKWEEIQARLYKINVRSLSVNNIQNSGAQFIDNIKNVTITFFSAKAVLEGDMTFGIMISTQFIIGMLNGPVSQFIQFIISFQLAKLSFLRLNEIQSLKDEEDDQISSSIELPSERSIKLQNVSFQYYRNAPVVLKNIYLTIPEGKVTAIVGDSGSGKSTLLKLILRLYKPSHGQILIGNMNVNNISLKQWREKCGAVMQDGKIFNDTVLNNIILDDENTNYERLRWALSTANIGDEIEKLPLGYQTMMGEQGRGLSGGQKQRILIARALYKSPDYLFLDEATNSLDTLNEHKIVTALHNAFQGKTVVVVAHRLSTIRRAEQIVVMQDGNIVEVGNHENLIQNRKRYFQLIESQLDLSSTIFSKASPVIDSNCETDNSTYHDK